MTNSGSFEHGTRGGYTNHACRCEDCLAAEREYQRGRKKKRANERQYKKQHARNEKAKRHAKRTGFRHGTLYGYTTRACRCWDCTEAGSSYARVRNGGTAPKNKENKYGTKRSTGNGLEGVRSGLIE